MSTDSNSKFEFIQRRRSKAIIPLSIECKIYKEGRNIREVEGGKQVLLFGNLSGIV